MRSNRQTAELDAMNPQYDVIAIFYAGVETIMEVIVWLYAIFVAFLLIMPALVEVFFRRKKDDTCRTSKPSSTSETTRRR